MRLTSKFEWVFKYEQQNLNDEDLRPFKLDKVFQYSEMTICHILYNHTYTKMYASTEEGFIVTFPKEGESNQMEEEDEPQDKEQEVGAFGPALWLLSGCLTVASLLSLRAVFVFVGSFFVALLCLTIISAACRKRMKKMKSRSFRSKP